jgi:hypothetical protein
MNFFNLTAQGADFDVDSYAETTPLALTNIWRRGEQKRFSCIESAYELSGVEIVLGDGSALPFFEQQRIAIDYCSKRGEAIRALCSRDDVEDVRVSLHYPFPLDEGLTGFAIGVEPALTWYALKCGFRLTTIVWIGDEEESRRPRPNLVKRLPKGLSSRSKSTLADRRPGANSTSLIRHPARGSIRLGQPRRRRNDS